MNKKVTAILLLTATLIAPAYAGSTSAQLSVSVEVVARTILTIDSQPANIEITADDVARGYVDVPQAMLFHVRSNAINGYTVQFDPMNHPFSRADINWGNTAATVGADGTWLTRPYQQGTTPGSLNVRLTLSANASPGSYSWPVRVAANSL
ncbi:MAG TPA: hypothetical protein VKL19_02555 [Thermoanaerobaculia bacterium]|nr:hypothetical protein [Thermoanaerobaculia bacterium]